MRRADWRMTLCHPVNIHIFQNGAERKSPTLVHISSEKKKSMDAIMNAIQERVKLSCGYPSVLYHMDGQRVSQPYEIETHNCYVVASNMDKAFRCVDYGEDRSPLVVVGPRSKNVRSIEHGYIKRGFNSIRQNNRHSAQMRYAFASSYASDGFGPTNLPFVSNQSNECGVLCQKKGKGFNKPPEFREDPCYRMEVISHPPILEPKYFNGKGDNIFSTDSCRGTQTDYFKSYYEESCTQTLNSSLTNKHTQSDGNLSCECDCDPLPKFETYKPVLMIDEAIDTSDIPKECLNVVPNVEPEKVLHFVNRTRDIGGDLYRLFNNRLSNKDMHEHTESKGKASESAENKPKDNRMADDFYMKFYDRMYQSMYPSETELDSRAEEPTDTEDEWITDTEDEDTTLPHVLPSLPDLKDMDDSSTGTQSGLILGSNNVENEEEYGKPTDNPAIAAILESLSAPDEDKTGTTRTNKSPAKNYEIYPTTVQSLNNPFYMDPNGKLQIKKLEPTLELIESNKKEFGKQMPLNNSKKSVKVQVDCRADGDYISSPLNLPVQNSFGMLDQHSNQNDTSFRERSNYEEDLYYLSRKYTSGTQLRMPFPFTELSPLIQYPNKRTIENRSISPTNNPLSIPSKRNPIFPIKNQLRSPNVGMISSYNNALVRLPQAPMNLMPTVQVSPYHLPLKVSGPRRNNLVPFIPFGSNNNPALTNQNSLTPILDKYGNILYYVS